MTFNQIWTPERIDDVRRLAATGMSASQIAAEIGGCSRNAVVGAGYRNGIRFTNPGGKSGGTTKPLLLGGRRFPKAPVVVTIAPEPRAGMLTLDELAKDSCRWIADDVRDPNHRYCGQPQVAGYSWCRDHRKLAYQPR